MVNDKITLNFEIEKGEPIDRYYSSFHRSPDMIRLRIDGDKEVGCRQHIVMI